MIKLESTGIVLLLWLVIGSSFFATVHSVEFIRLGTFDNLKHIKANYQDIITVRLYHLQGMFILSQPECSGLDVVTHKSNHHFVETTFEVQDPGSYVITSNGTGICSPPTHCDTIYYSFTIDVEEI
ncbi:hypothetical protein DFA_09371 [Cavenderia fasciculata]|uniref:GOLD domain-containing protein n=1 Tax=Cavenderia fasciculata TaxID=261658 RepID=F4Q7F9_CACFS|nr:uncharacterized protein DFA_09371 [Cavenderia fasciculata]EGG16341.1 hypothetical protein DFA_09371 [Cavenderia fasciculata]|eukprot:XP_004354725.1 hypothetical protein DFA_09371 [Cavenderia fasciculata]